MAWYQTRRADLGLRGAGPLLCGIGYVACAELFAVRSAPGQPGMDAYLLAAIGFLAASTGSALLILGNRLFDPIAVSPRWRGRPTELLLPLPESDAMTQIAKPALLVVGWDVDGNWTVRECTGMLLGRFASAPAAHLFAQAERRADPDVSVATSAGSPRRIEGRLTLASSRSMPLDVAHG